MLRRLPDTRVASRPVRRSSVAARSGTRHQPVPTGRGPRGCAPPRAAAPAGPGSTTARPCRPRRRRSRRPGASGRAAAGSWILDLARHRRRRRPPNAPALPVGQDRRSGGRRASARRPPSIDSARRPSTRPDRSAEAGRGGAVLIGAAHRVRTCPCRIERGTAQPEPKRVPVDQRRSSCGSRSGCRTSSRSSVRSVSGTPPQDQARAQQRLPRPAAR